MSVWVAPSLLEKPTGPLNISQEVLRSVLYGKWCNVFGGQKELTFKSGVLEKVDYNSDEGKKIQSSFTAMNNLFSFINKNL